MLEWGEEALAAQLGGGELICMQLLHKALPLCERGYAVGDRLLLLEGYPPLHHEKVVCLLEHPGYGGPLQLHLYGMPVVGHPGIGAGGYLLNPGWNVLQLLIYLDPPRRYGALDLLRAPR